jgi:hypothetical protein
VEQDYSSLPEAAFSLPLAAGGVASTQLQSLSAELHRGTTLLYNALFIG